jgi:hypothetical protein
MNRPWPYFKSRLTRTLPQNEETWQAQTLPVDEEIGSPWLVWVTGLGMVIKYKVSESQPTAEFLWDTLVRYLARVSRRRSVGGTAENVA